MNCFEVNQKLSGYLDRACSEGEMHEIEKHVKVCSKCASEVAVLNQIETVLSREAFSEPPKEYWASLPQRITKQIGFRTEPTPMDRFSLLVHEVFAPRRLVWGFAALAVIVTSVFLVKNSIDSNITHPPVAQEAVSEQQFSSDMESTQPTQTQETATVRSSTETSEPKETQVAFTQDNEAKSQVEGQPPAKGVSFEEMTATSVNSRGDMNVLVAMREVEPLPIRRGENVSVKPELGNQLFPVPNARFILPGQDSEEEENSSQVQTFSLEQNKQGYSTLSFPGLSRKLSKVENSFYETLWLVQESGSLEEKRNIWLSYLARESDPTYRSLATFNLAIVLSQMAEQTQNPGKAGEALDFFQEHEESLRFQIGDTRYQAKIALFQKIINEK
ncbi:zf-HC2 domain-containing protein [candidate division KSB1 bacterium]|nr:zf-HC2 domain-containing protein [candidate division KSB1 bacterium]NIR72560.1 zf-HC2 domain-containing protein [candidate division KSB1 bacterium]NIS27312.1 zf-HC2 domain-containing protein [candidate division KSB1 bacterium]NIT73522.1 zf-HC2 domain-containing protein [candidate division KSB1 bacterium]NIU28042.1 zf-HC2 domain-containing protein [candidate division KSB1 bacterium]